MEISSAKRGHVQVVTLSGMIDTLAADELERNLNELIATGETVLLLDLAGVNHITSPGLAVFLLIWDRLRKSGGRFALCSPSEIVHRVFEKTGFYRRMEVFASVEEGLALLR
jgi:anti-anti-sigma factor